MAITASTSSSGALAPAVTPTIARVADVAEVELVGSVDTQHGRAPGFARDLRERDRVRRVRAADHDDRVGAARDLGERVAGGWSSQSTDRCGSRSTPTGTVPALRRRSRPIRSGRASSARARRPGRDRRRSAAAASRSPTCSTSRIESGATASVPTASSWPAWPTYRIVKPLRARTLASWCTLVTSGHTAFDDVAAVGACRVDDLGRAAVGRQHERRAGRDVGDVVDEDHALSRGSGRPPTGCGRSRGSSRRAARTRAPSTRGP